MNFENLLQLKKNEIINKTQELIRINSIESDPIEGMPFGKGVNEALEYVLNLCEEMGFKTKNVDGYAGHADFGEGDETIGVLVHIDVVPVGDSNSWKFHPFSATIDDGKIYGRGAIDDKGPTIATIYALNILKESSVKLNKKIRIIFGTDEESGWECMKYYLKREKVPDLGFTPDASFPVIYGEKGILTLKLKQEFKDNQNEKNVLIYLRGGKLSNIVPNYAEALIKVEEKNAKSLYEDFLIEIKNKNYSIEVELNNDKILLKSHGLASHAFAPEKGKNSISQIIKFLGKYKSIITDKYKFIDFYNTKLSTDTTGKLIGCNMEDKDSGELTLNVGIVNLYDNIVETTLNIRYPITKRSDEIIKIINENTSEFDIKLEVLDDMEPLYVPKDSKIVKTLTNVYKKIMNDDTPPLTFGGGTYARALKNAVAFGPVFPGQINLAHQTDEYIEIDDLIKNTEIITHALYELSKTE